MIVTQRYACDRFSVAIFKFRSIVIKSCLNQTKAVRVPSSVQYRMARVSEHCLPASWTNGSFHHIETLILILCTDDYKDSSLSLYLSQSTLAHYMSSVFAQHHCPFTYLILFRVYEALWPSSHNF
jgi:hypothetical protein